MAGHSHSANVKHRKQRQDNMRSQLFLKLYKKIELLLQETGEINEKILLLAKKHNLSKEKICQLLAKIKKKKA